MIEIIGWMAVALIIYKVIKKIFFRKKTIKSEIILDSKEIEHYGPFSGCFRYKK